VALVAFATSDEYWSRMSTIWSPKGGGYDESGIFTRLELWQHGVKLFMNNAVTGVGIGMYATAEGLSHGGRGRWTAAHNSFTQLATDLGVIGFALFVLTLVVAIRNARRAIRAARSAGGLDDVAWLAPAVETSLYAYVVMGFALSQAYAAMLYFLIGAAAALRLVVERGGGNAVPGDVAGVPDPQAKWWRADPLPRTAR
jgi:O-antigen ligase